MNDLSTLYRTDYSAWAGRHAELLRAGRYADLDLENLLRELSDMSKSERRELESRLLLLLARLLQWEYQYPTLSARSREFTGERWRASIIEQRKQLAVLLRQSPGLQSVLAEAIAAAYPDAVDLASTEARLPPQTFPPRCPYDSAPVLDDDYYPGLPEGGDAAD